MASSKGEWATAGSWSGHAARTIVRSNPVAAAKLCEPDVVMHGCPVNDHGLIERFRRHGIIRQLERCDRNHEDCPSEGEAGCTTWLWRTDARAYAMVQEELEHRTLLECGHPPFSNPEGVEGYECTHEDCDARYTRAEIEEVLD